jgi:NUMOD4 motif
VPGYQGSYEVSNCGHVRSVLRVVTKCNVARYTVRECILKPRIHEPSGFQIVALARRGKYRSFYIHKLVRDLFGEEAA